MTDRRQPIGVRVRHGPEDGRVEQAEHGAVGADAEAEREDGDEGEAGGLAYQAQRVADVAPQRVEPGGKAALVPAGILDPLDAAERRRAACRASSADNPRAVCASTSRSKWDRSSSVRSCSTGRRRTIDRSSSVIRAMARMAPLDNLQGREDAVTACRYTREGSKPRTAAAGNRRRRVDGARPWPGGHDLLLQSRKTNQLDRHPKCRMLNHSAADDFFLLALQCMTRA